MNMHEKILAHLEKHDQAIETILKKLNINQEEPEEETFEECCNNCIYINTSDKVMPCNSCCLNNAYPENIKNILNCHFELNPGLPQEKKQDPKPTHVEAPKRQMEITITKPGKEPAKRGEWRNNLPELQAIGKICTGFNLKFETVQKYIRLKKFKAFRVMMQDPVAFLIYVDMESFLRYWENKGRRNK